MPARIDLTGQTFNSWTVQDRVPDQKLWSTWSCICVCGKVETFIGQFLRSGQATSCGCTGTRLGRGRPVSHGLSNTPEYRSWAMMWDRCTNSLNPNYPRYKDRRPPEIWRDFEVFLKDMGPRPTPDHTLDRTRNGEPYGPGNCRWATWDEQAENRSNNVWLEVEGQNITQSALARMCGTSPTQIFQLLKTKTVKEILIKYQKAQNQ